MHWRRSDEEKIDKEMLVRKEVEHYEDADPMVLMPLLDYQRQFLWWAGVQEKGDMRGGILADEVRRDGDEDVRMPFFSVCQLQSLRVCVVFLEVPLDQYGIKTACVTVRLQMGMGKTIQAISIICSHR